MSKCSQRKRKREASERKFISNASRLPPLLPWPSSSSSARGRKLSIHQRVSLLMCSSTLGRHIGIGFEMASKLFAYPLGSPTARPPVRLQQPKCCLTLSACVCLCVCVCMCVRVCVPRASRSPNSTRQQLTHTSGGTRRAPLHAAVVSAVAAAVESYCKGNIVQLASWPNRGAAAAPLLDQEWHTQDCAM